MEVDFDKSNVFEWMKDNLSYFEGDDKPFNITITNNNSPLTVITGDNACGKSYLRKILQSMCAMRTPKIECIHLSQAGRTQEGIQRAFIYGSEQDDSTGNNTVHTMLTSFKTSRSRDEEHLLVYDEPEIGLSDEYSAGLGIRIREFIEDTPEYLFGAVVITHSSHLLKELLPLNPNHVNMSDERDLKTITHREIIPNPDLEGLTERSLETFRKISKIQREKNNEK